MSSEKGDDSIHERGAGSPPLGPFRIVRLLGRGGQGEVHEAIESGLERRVALKVLTLDRLGGDPRLVSEVRARFEREAGLAARLDHPNVCAVHAFGEDAGRMWIAMPLIEGISLQELIARSRESGSSVLAPELVGSESPNPRNTQPSDRTVVLDDETTEAIPLDGEDETRRGRVAPATGARGTSSRVLDARRTASTLRLFETLARALDTAHDRGLVHRDVKPGNVMIRTDGSPVILDFGLATDTSSDGATLTQSGDVFGTPAYMAPEQIRGEHRLIDRRTDTYALGVMLFEALTLQRPFDAPTREGLFHAVLTGVPPRASKLGQQVSLDLEAVLDRAIEKDVERRYRTAGALADDLRAVREGRSPGARRLGPLGRALRWSRRHRVAAVLIIVLALGIPALASLGGFLIASLPDLERQAAADRFERTEALLDEGYFEAYLGDGERARSRFEEALEVSPDSVEARAGLADLAYEYGRWDEARQHLASIADHPESDALDALRIAMRPEGEPAREPKTHRPRTALGWFLLGTVAHRRGLTREREGDAPAADRFFRDACAHLRRAVALSDRPRRTTFTLLALAAVRLEDVRDLDWLADALRKHGEETPRSLWWIAASERDPLASWQAWTNYVSREPSSVNGWFNRGTAAWQVARISDASREDRGRATNDARAALDRAIALDPDHLPARINRAHLAISEGAIEDARLHVARARDLGGEQEQVFLLRARWAQANDDRAGALAIWRDGCERLPRAVALRERLMVSLQDGGESHAALEVATETLALDPRSEIATFVSLNALLSLQRIEDAWRRAHDALRERPDSAAILEAFARIAMIRGEDSVAEHAALDALRLDPTVHGAHDTLARVCWNTGRRQDAIGHLRRFLEHAPDDAERQARLAGMALAVDDGELARLASLRALALDPSLDEARRHLQRALFALGRGSEALNAARRLCEAEPDDPAHVALLARGLRAAGQLEEAASTWLRATQLVPDSAEFHCQLGDVFLRLGRIPDAARAFRQGHLLGSGQADWSAPSDRWLAEAVLTWAEALLESGRREDARALLLDHARAFPRIAAFANAVLRLDD